MAVNGQLTRARGQNFTTSHEGAIAVEFAFIAPVILIMLLGVVEVSSAISSNLTVQAAARAGTHYGLTTPPVQGDMTPVINSVKAALPVAWTAAGAATPATINASVICECENTGPVACGGTCAAGENKQEYLKVDVSKPYKPIVTPRYFATNFVFTNSSQIRLK
ncbi:MAG: TadE family protein [Hyphomicrobium sp.]